MRRLGLLLAVLAACSSSDASVNFTWRLEQGASCAELFEIRNQVGMQTERYNEQLREIGCFSANSERTD